MPRIRWVAVSLGALLSLAACGSHAAAPTSTNRIWGVTLNNPWNTAATVDALSKLPIRPVARVVFDEGQAASAYVDVVRQIKTVADIMGEMLDSQYVNTVSVSAYVSRANEYLRALGNSVDLWEVGNEVNGEWLGPTSDVVAKISGAYDAVKTARRPTALTLYYNQGCWSRADHEMFTWADANIPDRMKTGLDYVFVSYYEDDCNGLQPDWNAIFQRLATMFPNSKLGIGECGTTKASEKAAYLTRYYTMSVNLPRFVGGDFWWYASEDLVPATAPLWSTLAQIMAASK